ncbi:MAG TPA: SIMPL domain-containing protein [Jatrophihabitans sp.]
MTTPSAPFVSVRGEAIVQAAPDLAQLSITVTAQDSDRARTVSVLADRAATVQALLDQYAAGIEKSQTSQLSVYPEVKGGRGERVRRYTGTVTHSVTVKDFDVLSDLIVAVNEIELAQISGPWWQLRSDSPVYRQARLAAVTDAKQRAREYAAAFGAEIIGLVEVSDLGMSSSGAPVQMSMAAMARPAGQWQDDVAFDLQPAQQDVHGQVEARFTMSQPDLSQPDLSQPS